MIRQRQDEIARSAELLKQRLDEERRKMQEITAQAPRQPSMNEERPVEWRGGSAEAGAVSQGAALSAGMDMSERNPWVLYVLGFLAGFWFGFAAAGYMGWPLWVVLLSGGVVGAVVVYLIRRDQ